MIPIGELFVNVLHVLGIVTCVVALPLIATMLVVRVLMWLFNLLFDCP